MASTMRHFCTLFDRNYIDRGLSLHRSLVRHGGSFRLYILCLDQVTEEAVAAMRLQHVQLLGLDVLQSWDEAIAGARGNRGLVEFYFTCKPALLSYVLAREPSATRVEYLDSDLFFFSSPSSVEAAYAKSSVALSPHRFDATNAWRRQYGEFNAGWVSVGAGSEGRQFVAWWRDRCIESCALVPGREIYGDQKYLDRVPALFPAAVSVAHPGINAAPWNVGAAPVERTSEGVRIGGRTLVSFHFHNMRRMLFNLHETGLYDYQVPLTPAIRDGIYRPYVSELIGSRRQLSRLPATLQRRLSEPGPNPVGIVRKLVRTLRAVRRHTALASA